MGDLLKAWRSLQVAVRTADAGVKILDYSYVWTGSNGQQSRCSFLQGSEAVLLPSDGYSKAELTGIIFSSVQLKGKAIGKGRFKFKDSEESGEVGTAAVGHRLISAYLLQSGLTSEEEIATTFGLKKLSRKRDDPEPTQDASAQPVIRTTEQMQRAKNDAWHDKACSSLARHPEWYAVSREVSEEGQRAHKVIKLSAAADCPGFGKAKYKALKKRSWKLCAECSGIFMDLKHLERHRCADSGDSAASESSQPPAAEPALAPVSAPAIAAHATQPGGLWVQTTIAQVTDCDSVLR